MKSANNIQVGWSPFIMVAFSLTAIFFIVAWLHPAPATTGKVLATLWLYVSLITFLAFRWHKVVTTFSSGEISKEFFAAQAPKIMSQPIYIWVIWLLFTVAVCILILFIAASLS